MTPSRSGQTWARVAARGPHRLRRGGWYRVLDDSDPHEVVLSVAGKPHRVMRVAVTLAEQRPPVWSVVRRDPRVPGAPAVREVGDLYGVCPNCLHRAPLTTKDLELRCPRCNHLFGVDWSQA